MHDEKPGFLSCDSEALKYPNRPDPVVCEFCGAPRFTRGVGLLGRVWWCPSPEPCTCPEGMAAYEAERDNRKTQDEAKRKSEENLKFRERVKEAIRSSGLTERSLRQTFDNFQLHSDNRNAYAVCAAFARDLEHKLPNLDRPNPGRNGLLLIGPFGTGKTHLSFAIANALLMRGTPVIAMTALELLAKIRRTYSLDNLQEDEVLDAYCTVPLLVLDDLGKEKSSLWTASMLYSIIDRRYNAMLPTIVTSNYNAEGLVERLTPSDSHDRTTALATVDRLAEMCDVVTLTGPSWRRK